MYRFVCQISNIFVILHYANYHLKIHIVSKEHIVLQKKL